MRCRATFAFAVAGLLICPAIASAQSQPGAGSETGSLIKRAPAVVVDGRSLTAAREATRQFGACVVSRRPVFAVRVMQMPVDDPEFSKLMKRLASDECMADGSLTVPILLFRTAVFEAAYLKEFGKSPPEDLKLAPVVDYTVGYSAPLTSTAAVTIALGRMGDCVARADSKAAHFLVTSRPGTALENDAFSVLLKPLPACVVKGETVRISKPVVRGAIVEALYRIRQGQGLQGAKP